MSRYATGGNTGQGKDGYGASDPLFPERLRTGSTSLVFPARMAAGFHREAFSLGESIFFHKN